MSKLEDLPDGKGCFILFMRMVAALITVGVSLGVLIGWLVA